MVSWTFPMAYSKATLKSNGAKASPWFRPIWENFPDDDATEIALL
jgi:hypothetical protein